MGTRLCIISLLFLATSVMARDWERIYIPGAKCGDGATYSVFVDKRKKDKLAVEFMMGGACWSWDTCYGPNFRTWIHPVPKIANYSVMTKNNSILGTHSMIYFPYCTGDVYAGNHVAEYGMKARVYHYGDRNVQLTLDYLQKKGIIDFKAVKSLVLYGASAGAIGSLIHTVTFDKYVKSANKTIIADAPGLHWGKNFWEKFTIRQVEDFKNIFDRINFHPPLTDGLIAPYLKDACQKLSHWNIGILQGTQDVIMSTVFGNILPSEQETNIYSERGILNTLQGTSNCSTWIKKTKMHTFLLASKSAEMTVEKFSALDYAEDIYNGKNGINYSE